MMIILVFFYFNEKPEITGNFDLYPLKSFTYVFEHFVLEHNHISYSYTSSLFVLLYELHGHDC